MAEPQEKQWELGGVTFGHGSPIQVLAEGWSPGAATIRTKDSDIIGSDGVRFGRDFKGSATWSFSMYTNGATEDEAWASLAELAAAWDAEEIRSDPGAVLPLRYRIAGQMRRVYGRPRLWTPVVDNTSLGGRIDVEASFATVDHRHYADEEKTLQIPLAAPLEVDAGLEVPFIPPFVTNAGSAVRQTAVHIGGDIPTPITVTFNGPVDTPALRAADWTAQVNGKVAANDPVTVDGRPWVRAATYRSGGGAPVAPRVTRISKMWLPPGTHELIFTGTDISGTATALVSWREAYRTPR